MTVDSKVAGLIPDNRKKNKSQMQKTDLPKPSNLLADRVMFLQRTVGNKVVEQMIRAEFLRAQQSYVQMLFPNTHYGRGAVIRHIILGYYPDDYRKNSEQLARDEEMERESKEWMGIRRPFHRQA